jgi:hypothetical protein
MYQFNYSLLKKRQLLTIIVRVSFDFMSVQARTIYKAPFLLILSGNAKLPKMSKTFEMPPVLPFSLIKSHLL